MKRLLLALGLLLALLPTVAQQPVFRAFSFPEGQRQARVGKIAQSPDGYIWLGSPQGLFRFDGQALGLIYSDSVSALYSGKSGRAWVGTKGGTVLSLEGGGIADGLEYGLSAPVTAFAEDVEGRLWIATYGKGLYCWADATLLHFPEEGEIYDMTADAYGQVWFGTDRGLFLLRFNGDEKHVVRVEGLPDEIVRVVHPGDSTGIWAGMHDGGVCRVNPLSKQVTFTTTDWDLGVTTALACFSNEIWIGTDGKGLHRLDLATGAIKKLEGGPGAKISALLADDEGLVWVSGGAPGFFSASRLFEEGPSIGGDIQAVLAARDGSVWAGGQNGLWRKPVSEDTVYQALPGLGLNVISLYEDPFSNIWAGTFGEGVYCLSPQSGKFIHIPEGSLLHNGSVLSMDGRGNTLWLATLGGVVEMALVGDPLEGGRITARYYDKESGLGANYIYRAMVDSKGRVWFGADGQGLSVLENGAIRNYPQAQGISLKAVYSIAEDHAGRIWFTASNQGLFSLAGERFLHYGQEQGLRNLSVSALAAAGRYLLVVHAGGVDLLDPDTGHWMYFNEGEGEANLNALSRGPGGYVWIGMPKRLLRYAPLAETMRIHPKICLENVSVLQKSINWRSKTEFRHRENFLVFDFAGIWLTDADRVSYRYMLEGFDRDWIYSRDRRATYSSLPPGKYVFRVSASENGVFSDEPEAEYRFVIRPPFWERPWFIQLAILGFGALAYGAAQRIKRVENLKKASVQSQYEALKSQVNPHFLFNSFNTLIAFIEENPPLAVEYTEKLSDFYRAILAHREKDRISLKEELKLAEDFGYLLKMRFGDSFSLEIRIDNVSGYIAPLALQILIENAVKHNVASRGKPLRVRIERRDDYLLIANTLQRKTGQEASTGFGLSSLISRYGLLTKRPVLAGERDGEFQVRLPLLGSTT
jgi:ligand-binding sensor domain-containing protein